jgi:hypothetical protein
MSSDKRNKGDGRDCMSPAKTGRKQPEDTRFKPGQSGNPSGRPCGSRNKATLAIDALLDGEAEKLTRKAIDLANGGDLQALKLCMDRIVPPRRDRPVTFTLPVIEGPAQAPTAMAAVLKAAADGELTPMEAGEIAKLLDVYVRSVEANDLAKRIDQLEKAATR